MPFKFPTACEDALVEVMSDAAKGVFDSVFDGTAFKNPAAESLSGATDLLNSTSLKLNELIQQAGDGELSDVLGNIRDMLGIGADGEVIGGIIDGLGEFKQHSDMMSGVGDLDAFAERMGVAGSFDGAMQRLGEGEGAFGDIFRSMETSGQLIDTIQNQLGELGGLLDAGLDDLDVQDIIALGAAIGIQGGEIVGQIDLDNAAFAGASMVIQKMGIADMITDNNCYIKDMMDKMIGSDELNENLPAAVEEQHGPSFDELEKEAIAQEEQISAEEAKANGVHSPALAGMAGQSMVKTPAEKKAAAGKPKYGLMRPGNSWDSSETEKMLSDKKAFFFPGLTQRPGRPIWDENIIGFDGEQGAWIQWWAHKFGGTKIVRKEGGGWFSSTPEVTTITHEGDRSVALQMLMWDIKRLDWYPKRVTRDTKFLDTGRDVFYGTWHTYDITNNLDNIWGDDIELADGYLFEKEIKLYHPVL